LSQGKLSSQKWIEKVSSKVPELDISEADLETSSLLYFRELLLKFKDSYINDQLISEEIKLIAVK
jgi:hypothetical protein